MTVVAIIQNTHRVLNEPNADGLSGFTKQVYEKFFDILVEESGHDLQLAKDLESYDSTYSDTPDVVICSPFPETGNVAPGFMELTRFINRFPDIPIIVWSDRNENAIQDSVLNEYHVAHYYTGTLIDSPDDFADLILKYS